MIRKLLLAGVLVAVTAPISAQTLHANGPLPKFEVVSIRIWKRPASPPPLPAGVPGAAPKVMKVDPTAGGERGVPKARLHNIMPLKILIAEAYRLPMDSSRIVGVPAWMQQDDTQYDITAKIDDETFAAMQTMKPAEQHDEVRLMQQTLLAERFGLKVHFEQRELPIFALVVAKGGTKLTPAKAGEVSKLANFVDDRGSGLEGTAVTLDMLLKSPLFLGSRTVVNQTGLNGAYDFKLRYAGDSGDDEQPGLITALQNQMGLKLVATKGMVEVVVIDHAERPSEN